MPKLKILVAALSLGLIFAAVPVVHAEKFLEISTEKDAIMIEQKTETKQISEIENALDLVKTEIAKLETQLEVMQLEDTNEMSVPELPENSIAENEYSVANFEPLFQFSRRIEKRPKKVVTQNHNLELLVQSADILAYETMFEVADPVASKKTNQLLSVYSLISFGALLVIGAIIFIVRFARHEKKLSARIGQLRLMDLPKTR